MPKLTHASKSNPCPICGRTDWCYEVSDSLWSCKRADSAPPGWRKTNKQDKEGHWFFAVDTGDSSEWTAKKAEWDAKEKERFANRVEIQRQEFKTSLTAAQRDPLIRALSQELGLSRQHRQMLLDRGLTDEQIDGALFFSIEKYQQISAKYPLNLPGVYLSKFGDKQLRGEGIAIVTQDADGLATGWQVMAVPRIDGAKYTWAKGDKSSHLPIGEGELPIIAVGIPTEIAYTCEGILKPVVASHRHEKYFIGAGSGNFSGSPLQVAAALKQSHTVVIPIDGGDPINLSRMAHWQRQAEFFGSLGKKVLFAWWGQYTKAIGDIDEIALDTPIAYIPFDKLSRFSLDRLLYEDLTQLTYQNVTPRNERYLSALPLPLPGEILVVGSPCATGKTEQLKPIVKDWRTTYPNGGVIDLTHLNSIKAGHQERLDIDEYRVGFGQNDAAINSMSAISICIDSLDRLRLDSIRPNTLLVMDEVEAVLESLAKGGTLGDKTARIQAHVTQIVRRVLELGGAIVALEDSITDLSIQALLDLSDRRYKLDLIVNEYQPFKWDVTIGGGNNGAYLAYMLGKLQAGEKIFAPCTSQNYGEALQRLVHEYLPELVDKTERVDAKTSPDLQELLRNPNQYLKGREIRLLVGSPTIKIGFDISTGQFDRTMARFTNLDTRSQIQMLHRERSDAARDIFITKKGAEISGFNGKNAAKLAKTRESIANRTSMATGNGRIVNDLVGEIWNRLDAQFSARSALSAAYLEDYLRCDLASRGHKISPADWTTGTDLTLAAELGIRFKEIRQEVLVEENRILFQADGKSISLEQANMILHSSGVRFEERQKAKKAILHHDLPGVEFSEEFLMKAVTENRGAYRFQCELAWFLDKPELGNWRDKKRFTSQLESPHILFSKAPKLGEKLRLLASIAADLEDLASGREYKDDDPVVLRIQAAAIEKSYDFGIIFGLTIRATEKDAKGNTNHSPTETTNKILRKLSYETKSIRREGGDGNRVRVWAVVNTDCPHRQTIYQALELKYRESLSEADSSIASTSPKASLDKEIVDGAPYFPPPPPPQLKKTDKVIYVGAERILQKQYAGVLEVCTVGSGVYSCYTNGGEKLTSWIDRDDLQLVG
jgi:hypothetical protein